MPKVSVIVPVCNVEEYLAECLDSVLGQTLKDIEVVCVDDGSSDSSGAILDSYAKKDSRVKAIHQKNSGSSAARNRALAESRGETVVFMDADDRYPRPDVLERMYGALAESGCQIAGGQATCFPAENPVAKEKNARAKLTCAFPRRGVIDFAEYQVPFRYWCYMFKREIAASVRFPDVRTFMDPVYFVRAMAKARKFVAMDECVYEYRQHGSNTSRSMSAAKVLDRLRGIREVMDIAEANGYGRLYDSMAAAAWKNIKKYRVGIKARTRTLGFLRTLFEFADFSKAASPGLKGAALSAFLKTANALFRACRIRPRRVFMQTFQGEYCCNPKYATAALAREASVETVWALSATADSHDVPMNVRIVRKGTLRCFWNIATAKVWLENGLNLVRSPFVRKRRGQVYLQPLHGSLGLKRQGLAGEAVRAKADAITDFCISNSAFETQVYRTSYWPTAEILEYGHPRNDVFFKSAAEKALVSRRVRETLGIGQDVRLALYAPTFRTDGDVSCLDLDPAALKTALERKFGGEWAVLFRLHKRDLAKCRAAPGGWMDASRHPDMQELMLACEVGITDYSSWICDYVLGDGFGFIYARDVEKYSHGPGFYYPLETTPFPVARSNGELAQAIAGFDPEEYSKRKAAFIASKGCVDDGRASERCAGKIMEVLG